MREAITFSQAKVQQWEARCKIIGEATTEVRVVYPTLESIEVEDSSISKILIKTGIYSDQMTQPMIKSRKTLVQCPLQ